MLNIVAHTPGSIGAVLIRACEPLRLLNNIPPKGPGRLSRALGIDKSLDGVPVYRKESPLTVHDSGILVRGSMISRSKRVGLKEDLEEPMRFCIRTSPYVSVKC
jgi:DNA-3-methyladenine glycosylase